jgi:hypothetical protein
MITRDSVRWLPSSSSRTGSPLSGFFFWNSGPILARHDVDLLGRNVEALLREVHAELLRVGSADEVVDLMAASVAARFC